MKEFDKHMTEPHEKWPSGILGHKPELTTQFHQLIDTINEVSDFFNAFPHDQINKTIISQDKRDYLGEQFTTVIIISLGMLEHMGCDFQQIFDEKMQRLCRQYKTDEAKKLVGNYKITIEEKVKHIIDKQKPPIQQTP